MYFLAGPLPWSHTTSTRGEKSREEVKIFKYLNYGENLRPFFSVEEIERAQKSPLQASEENKSE
jgi:hypothetical protein